MIDLKKLISNTSIVGILSIISRILGYIREIALTHWMGTSAATDGLIIATRIPTLLRKATTEGSLNNVLVPTMNKLQKQNKEELIAELISKTIKIFSLFFIAFAILEIIYLKQILSIISPGISEEIFYWTKYYSYFIGITILFFFLNGLFSAILNYHNKFFWPAMSPIIWNSILIISIVFSKMKNINIHYMGIIYLVATIFFTITTFIPYLTIKFKKSNNKNNKEESKTIFKEFFKNLLPIIFTNSTNNINNIILMSLISYLPTGSITLMNRVNRILEIPVALIIPLTITLLPEIAKEEKEGEKIIKWSLIATSIIFIPISIIFYFCSFNLVNAIFYFGKLPIKEINIMSELIKIYALAVPAILLNKIIPIFFFAKKEIKTPTIASLCNTISNVILNLFLIKYGLHGIATASVASYWIQTSILFYYMKKSNYI